ncbi:hypothetical protein C8R43DRAFT_952539 [Mycena crocata]|nr:hypothetical protein C8R43DRAFT_952539 [Mycena crocata]
MEEEAVPWDQAPRVNHAVTIQNPGSHRFGLNSSWTLTATQTQSRNIPSYESLALQELLETNINDSESDLTGSRLRTGFVNATNLGHFMCELLKILQAVNRSMREIFLWSIPSIFIPIFELKRSLSSSFSVGFTVPIHIANLEVRLDRSRQIRTRPKPRVPLNPLQGCTAELSEYNIKLLSLPRTVCIICGTAQSANLTSSTVERCTWTSASCEEDTAVGLPPIGGIIMTMSESDVQSAKQDHGILTARVFETRERREGRLFDAFPLMYQFLALECDDERGEGEQVLCDSDDGMRNEKRRAVRRAKGESRSTELECENNLSESIKSEFRVRSSGWMTSCKRNLVSLKPIQKLARNHSTQFNPYVYRWLMSLAFRFDGKHSGGNELTKAAKIMRKQAAEENRICVKSIVRRDIGKDMSLMSMVGDIKRTITHTGMAEIEHSRRKSIKTTEHNTSETRPLTMRHYGKHGGVIVMYDIHHQPAVR